MVQIFDTLTENVFAQRKYDKLAHIKGLGSIGTNIFNVRHVIVDEAGKLLVDNVSQQVSKKDKEVKPIHEWQLTMVAGSKVKCLTQNPFTPQ